MNENGYIPVATEDGLVHGKLDESGEYVSLVYVKDEEGNMVTVPAEVCICNVEDEEDCECGAFELRGGLN